MNATGPSRRITASESLSLSCKAKFKHEGDEGREYLWKTCIWTRVSDGAACAIEAENDWETNIKQCDSSLGAVNIVGGDRLVCRINIPEATINDKGDWTCKMEECKYESAEGCADKDSGDCFGEDTVHIEVCTRSIMIF